MFPRLLLNPAPAEGGGEPTPAPAAAQTPPAPTPAPAATQSVTLTMEQFTQFQQAATTLAQVQEANRKAEADRLQALADKQAAEGRGEQAVQTLREKHAADLKAKEDAAAGWESRAKGFAKNSAILADLAARDNLQPGAAEKLARLYGDALRAHPEGEAFAVRTDTFQGVKDYFDAVLADPTNAIFLKPSNQGGAGGGGSKPAPTQAAPMTVSEALLVRAREERNAAPAPGAPIGLAPRVA